MAGSSIYEMGAELIKNINVITNTKDFKFTSIWHEHRGGFKEGGGAMPPWSSGGGARGPLFSYIIAKTA